MSNSDWIAKGIYFQLGWGDGQGRKGPLRRWHLSRDVSKGDIRDKGIGFQAERRAHNYNNDNTEIVERMWAFEKQREATWVGLNEEGEWQADHTGPVVTIKNFGCYSKAKRSHWRALQLEVARLGSDSSCLDFWIQQWHRGPDIGQKEKEQEKEKLL